MDAELSRSVTDLILGATTLALAVRLRGVAGVHRHWRRTFWFAGAAALAGALYHGPLGGSGSAAELTWVAVGVLIVVMLSYLLAASVVEVLGPGRGRVFLVIRSAGLVAYLLAVVLGNSGLNALLLCESLTMAAVLGLWALGARRSHPMAPAMIAAILASGLAGIVFALPERATDVVGLDPPSLSHLAQIPGMVLLFMAVAGAGRLQLRAPGRSPSAGGRHRRVPFGVP